MKALTPHETLQLAQFALDHAEEPVLWTNSEGSLLYANAAAGSALNSSPEEIKKSLLSDICPDLTADMWSQLLKDLKNQKSFAFEFSVRARGGRTFTAEISVRRMPLEGQDLLCIFFRDIEERKLLQQMKNEFVSTVSHELRTPMTIIRESVSQLLDGLLGDMPPPQREALHLTLSGIDRLARIINDLLDISKMEAGKATVRWDRIRLAELVREVVETFSPRARERGLEIAFTLPSNDLIIYADYDRLSQVFTNLIGNALKFSEKGRIEISVLDADNQIECTVSDMGLGIPKDDLGRVFNKFEQLSQPAVTGEKGSGLGLSICKGIVELHQGRIWAESEPGSGSRFIFTLPRHEGLELFRQRLATALKQAASTRGHVTALVLEVKSLTDKTAARDTQTLKQWALDELVETIKTQGVRKSDILIEDAQAVWLGLIGMTNKEAKRIAQNILAAYALLLEKNDVHHRLQVVMAQCSYPEEGLNEKDLLAALSERHRKHAS